VKIDERFKKGLELFNHQEFFECHEVIEALWLETDPKDKYRDLYKGVIQAAAALYQFKRGVLSGALGLFGSSTVYLEKYKPSALGLDVQKLIREMNGYFAVLNDWDGKKEIPWQPKLLPVLNYHLD